MKYSDYKQTGMRKILLLAFAMLFLPMVNGVKSMMATAQTAQWITAGDTTVNDVNTWLMFRKDIKVKKVPERVVARVAVDSKYWLWINGQMIVFEGGLKRGPNPKDTYCDEVDLKPYLKKGKNQVAVLVWYFGKHGYSHKSSGLSGLFFEAPAIGLQSDRTWHSMKHPAYSIATGEKTNFRLPESSLCYDMRKDPGEWQTLPMHDFQPSKELGAEGSKPWGRLVPRPIPLWRDYGVKSLKFTRTETDSTVTYEAVLPYNMQMTPVVELTDNGEGGTRIDIETDHYKGGRQVDIRAQLITRPGHQQYESLGWFNGERIYIRCPNKNVILHSLGYRETGYDADAEGTFTCDDQFINRFWQKASRTLYVNMRDTYFDCPDRERAQWWGDATVLMGESFYTYSTSAHHLMRKAIRELCDWQRDDNTLFSPIPAGNYDQELPAQMLTSVGEYGFWQYFMHTADTATIRYAYPHVRRYLSVWQQDSTGLTIERKGGWQWGDWGRHKDMRLLQAGWHYMALTAASKMARLLDNEADAADYDAKALRVKDGYNRCWTGTAYHSLENRDTLDDDRVQALAVISGIATPDKYEAITEVFRKQWHASAYMERYVMEALIMMGQTDYAFERMKKRYEKMVNDPTCSTLFEDWVKGGAGGGSTNHAWSGGPQTVIAQYILGIRPTAAGWKEVIIHPIISPLHEASITIPSICGILSYNFKDDGTTYRAIVTVPEGVQVRFIAPDGYSMPGGCEQVLGIGIHELNCQKIRAI